MLQRLGFGRAHARALDERSDMTSAYLHQLTLAMRRCHDSRVEQAMASPPDGGPVAAPHVLEQLRAEAIQKTGPEGTVCARIERAGALAIQK